MVEVYQSSGEKCGVHECCLVCADELACGKGGYGCDGEPVFHCGEWYESEQAADEGAFEEPDVVGEAVDQVLECQFVAEYDSVEEPYNAEAYGAWQQELTGFAAQHPGEACAHCHGEEEAGDHHEQRHVECVDMVVDGTVEAVDACEVLRVSPQDEEYGDGFQYVHRLQSCGGLCLHKRL